MAAPLNVLVYLRESNARYRERLTDSNEVRYVFCDSEDEVRASIDAADVLLGSIHFPSHLLSSADRLRWIQVTGAGVDAFLARSHLPEGVRLTRADISFGDQIAEYVIGHLLAITQRLREVIQHQADHCWQPLEVEFIKGKTMGIAGTGSIGQAVADRARGMGMETIGLANKRRPIPGFSTIYDTTGLTPFLRELDVLVICLPLTTATRGLFGHSELAVLKSSALVINVARGAIIDEAALIDALQAGSLRGAILDVFDQEPLDASSPLWRLDNVTVTSHHSGLNIPDEMIDFFADNLRRFRTGQPLNGQVDLAKGY